MTAAEQRAALAELRELLRAAEVGSGLMAGPYYRSDVIRRDNAETVAHGKPWHTPAGNTRAALIAAALTALPWLLDAAERGLHHSEMTCAGCGEPIDGPWQHCDGRDYHEECGGTDGEAERRTDGDS